MSEGKEDAKEESGEKDAAPRRPRRERKDDAPQQARMESFDGSEGNAPAAKPGRRRRGSEEDGGWMNTGPSDNKSRLSIDAGDAMPDEIVM